MELLISTATLFSTSHAMMFCYQSHLSNLTQSKKDFPAGQIPETQHADLDQHLAAAPSDGGRHPLPEREVLADQFQQWGINLETRTVCYNQNNSAFAARLWWLCRWLGHDTVFVLDGGWDGWVQQRHPVSTQQETFPQGHFAPKAALKNICHAANLLSSSNTLLDARDSAKYRGEVEPIYPVAGHTLVPIFVPFSDNMSEKNFKPTAFLKQRFDALDLTQDTLLVCYCGLGVTAIHNAPALLIAGYSETTLHPGSWSEWTTDFARPVETV